MADALDPERAYRRVLHAEPGVGLGRVGLDFYGSGSDVVWSADGMLALVMEGELYDTAPLQRSVSDERRALRDDAVAAR